MSNFPFKIDDNQSKLSSNYPTFNAKDKLAPIPSYPAAERFKEILETAQARDTIDKCSNYKSQPKIQLNPEFTIPDTIPEYGFRLDKAQPINHYGSRKDYFEGATAASLQELRGEMYQFNKAQAAGDQVSMDYYQRKINNLKSQIFPSNDPVGKIQKEIDNVANQIQSTYDMNNPLPQALDRKWKMNGMVTSLNDQPKKDKIEELENIKQNLQNQQQEMNYNYSTQNDDNNKPPPSQPPGGDFNLPSSIEYYTKTLLDDENKYNNPVAAVPKEKVKLKKEKKEREEKGGYRYMENPLLQDEEIQKTLKNINNTAIAKTMPYENIQKTKELFEVPEMFIDEEEFEPEIYIAPEIQQMLEKLPSPEAKSIEHLKAIIENVLAKCVEKAKDLPSREQVLEVIHSGLQQIQQIIIQFIKTAKYTSNISKPALKEISKWLYKAVKIFAVSATKLGVLTGKLGIISAVATGYAAVKLASASIQAIIFAFHLLNENRNKQRHKTQEEPQFNYNYQHEEKEYKRSMPQLEEYNNYAYDYRQPKPKKPRKKRANELEQILKDQEHPFVPGPYEITKGAKGRGLKRNFNMVGHGYEDEVDFLRNVNRNNNHFQQSNKKVKNTLSYDDGQSGIYLIDKNKLKLERPILSVLRARNRKKTNEYKNQHISPECAHCFFQILANCNPDINKLEDREKVIVSKFIKRSRHPYLKAEYPWVKRSDPYPIEPKKVSKLDPIISLKRLLRRNLGEMDTGNDSIKLKYETRQIVNELFLKKQIDSKKFDKYCSIIKLPSNYTYTAADRELDKDNNSSEDDY